MNVEWWGGEQSSPPADCKSALPVLPSVSRRSNPAPLLKKLIWRMDGLRRLLHGEREGGATRAPCLLQVVDFG